MNIKALGNQKSTKPEENPNLPAQIAQQSPSLSATEIPVVEAIINKRPAESWDSTARKLGISRRALFTYRQSKRIQQALYNLVMGELRTDFIDVLRKLVNQAKSGNVTAAKVIIDYIDKSWDIEAETAQKLNLLREIILRALENAAPEIKEKVAYELKFIGLGHSDIGRT